MKIGFIGTGVMGSSMASHIKAPLYVYNRTKSKAQSLLNQGAVWCETPCAVAQSADVVITMLGYPNDVYETYLGKDSLIKGAKQDQIFIDCTTSSPELAQEIYNALKEKGVSVLDAPVSGGDVGAKNGTLSVMVGGDLDAYEKVMPLFEMFGQKIQYFGAAGSGQHTKMANQIAIASGMIGVAESLYYAKSAGLDLERVLATISQGAAGSWSLTNLAPRMLKGDYAPGFYTHHFLKDMGIALMEAEKMNIELPGLALAYEMYDALNDNLKATTGTQVIYQHYDV